MLARALAGFAVCVVGSSQKREICLKAHSLHLLLAVSFTSFAPSSAQSSRTHARRPSGFTPLTNACENSCFRFGLALGPFALAGPSPALREICAWHWHISQDVFLLVPFLRWASRLRPAPAPSSWNDASRRSAASTHAIICYKALTYKGQTEQQALPCLFPT